MNSCSRSLPAFQTLQVRFWKKESKYEVRRKNVGPSTGKPADAQEPSYPRPQPTPAAAKSGETLAQDVVNAAIQAGQFLSVGQARAIFSVGRVSTPTIPLLAHRNLSLQCVEQEVVARKSRMPVKVIRQTLALPLAQPCGMIRCRKRTGIHSCFSQNAQCSARRSVHEKACGQEDARAFGISLSGWRGKTWNGMENGPERKFPKENSGGKLNAWTCSLLQHTAALLTHQLPGDSVLTYTISSSNTRPPSCVARRRPKMSLSGKYRSTRTAPERAEAGNDRVD